MPTGCGWTVPDWPQLLARQHVAFRQGLRILALRTYEHAGRRYYAAAWRTGSGGEELGRRSRRRPGCSPATRAWGGT